MHPFRKKPPSSATPTNRQQATPSPIPGNTKQGPATVRPRGKGRKRFAASSSTTASLVTSPSCDPTDHTVDEPGSSKQSRWRAAYGAARMAVEIANASSDMFLPLKAVVGALSVLIKNYDQTTANTDQIREVEERIQSLSGILAYPVADQDGDEKARREVLRTRLAGIVVKLEPLGEQHGLMKFFKNVDNANILNGFVQDLTYAVTDYQTSLQQSIHENTKRIDETTNRIDETTKRIDENAQNIIEAADLELLGKLEPVRNAGYQAGHHDTCLRGTRESVLDGIVRWAKDPQDRHVFWLNGLAGTGKSTIAQTFSEMAAKTGILGASFFCSRDYLDRKELKNIFPTLAYQLACRYPAFRRHIIRVIKEDPSVASNSLISQLEDLIVGPLSSSKISCVIVVDALDECIDDQPASAILSVLGRHVKQLSSVEFFITGRPEPRIRTGFRLPVLEPLTKIFLLHEVKLSDVDEDIRLYLQDKLTAVSKRRSDLDLSDPWPRGEDLATLAKKSSGLFIFASTLVRFIESEHHEPNERLQLIITPPDSTVHEGRAGIDPLYTQILEHAFLNVKETTVFINLRRVLGAMVLAFNPLSRVQIAGILGVNTPLITRSLRHLHSVLSVPNEDSKEIRVFHKSFPDFLQDPDRCSDPKFFIDSPVHHGDITLDCLELLKKLKPNPCDLPDFVMNRDVVNLPELLEEKVGGATRYACGYWAMHIRSSPTANDYAIRLIPSATLYGLLDWLGVVRVPTSDLRSLAQDCLRFSMHFFHPIQQSALHIYHSALPLSPTSSAFRSRSLRMRSRITGSHGEPDAWGIVVRTITTSSKCFTGMTTFGHRIAASCDDGTVGIYDSITGVPRLSLDPTDPVQDMRGSPDGSILFCAHKTPSITVWDMQTGGLIHTLILERNPKDITTSLKGHYLACGLFDGSVVVWDVADGMEGAVIWTSPPVASFCWLELEERLAVSTGASVVIWDIVTGTILHGFAIRHPAQRMIYSQKFNHLAITASSASLSTITVINPQTGIPTISKPIHQNLTCFAFSQTTEELVCGSAVQGIRLFNVSTRRWRYIQHPDTITSVSPLSNGTVVAKFAGPSLQLLNLDGGYVTSLQPTIPILTLHAFDQGRIIAVLSTDRDQIVLLRLANMSQLLTIPVKNTHTIPTDRTAILCASLDNRMAAYYFRQGEGACVELWRFHDKHPSWTARPGGLPSTGGISPSGAWLVTYEVGRNAASISVWDMQSGQRKGWLQVHHTNPFETTFDSRYRFCLHHDTYRAFYQISPESGSGIHFDTNHLNHRQLPLARESQQRYYDVDETREWVVSGSKRICWIPPGYIGSARRSYWWVGYSLVMAGQDGTLRRMTFRG